MDMQIISRLPYLSGLLVHYLLFPGLDGGKDMAKTINWSKYRQNDTQKQK